VARATPVVSASPLPPIGRSYVDLDRGIFYRLPQGDSRPYRSPRLLAHMRRWRTRSSVRTHFVEQDSAPVRSVKTAFKRA